MVRISRLFHRQTDVSDLMAEETDLRFCADERFGVGELAFAALIDDDSSEPYEQPDLPMDLASEDGIESADDIQFFWPPREIRQPRFPLRRRVRLALLRREVRLR